jgi:hypothetical protein
VSDECDICGNIPRHCHCNLVSLEDAKKAFRQMTKPAESEACECTACAYANGYTCEKCGLSHAPKRAETEGGGSVSEQVLEIAHEISLFLLSPPKRDYLDYEDFLRAVRSDLIRICDGGPR